MSFASDGADHHHPDLRHTIGKARLAAALAASGKARNPMAKVRKAKLRPVHSKTLWLTQAPADIPSRKRVNLLPRQGQLGGWSARFNTSVERRRGDIQVAGLIRACVRRASGPGRLNVEHRRFRDLRKLPSLQYRQASESLWTRKAFARGEKYSKDNRVSITTLETKRVVARMRHRRGRLPMRTNWSGIKVRRQMCLPGVRGFRFLQAFGSNRAGRQ